MIKLPLASAAIALTMAIGAPSLSADEWHHGGWHRGHSHHYGYYRPHRHYGWHGGNDGTYGRRAIYNAGFNHGAYAQWRLAYQRWAYEYAAYRQWRGPTGIFALAGGVTGLGAGYGGGPGYGAAGYGGGPGYGGGAGYGAGAGDGPPCNCD